MKKILLVCCCFSLFVFAMPACKSKKKCATFDNPDDNHQARYNKKGLVKKKGVRTPSNWKNKH